MNDLTRDLNRIWYRLAGIYSGLFFVAIGVVILAGYFHYRHLAESFGASARNSLVIHDMRQAILTLQPAVGNSFDLVEFETHGGQIIFSLTPQADGESPRHPLIPIVFHIPIGQDPGQPGGEIVGELNFYYSDLNSIGWGMLIWALSLLFFSPIFRWARASVEKGHKTVVALETAEATKRLARQVAHDIRSPLTALMILEKHLNELPLEKRNLLLSAAHRIRNVADDLLKSTASEVKTLQHDTSEITSEVLSQPILPLLMSTVREMQIQFQEHEQLVICLHAASPDADRIMARVSAPEFARVISNLINNAQQATVGSAQIDVYLRSEAGGVEIEIKDNGKGIPAAILPKLAAGGISFGKTGGSGLGLSHALQAVKVWGGTLVIDSQEGRGTSITLRLPIA